MHRFFSTSEKKKGDREGKAPPWCALSAARVVVAGGASASEVSSVAATGVTETKVGGKSG
jgi:hypothetical protein